MKGYAVVTGASSGIGAEFARQLAQKGYKLILTARRLEKLQEIAQEVKTECTIILADLSKEKDCFEFFEKIKQKRIDIFINNAGFGDCNEFVSGYLQKELDMIDVNIKAMHILMKLVVSKMEREGHGYFLNVASSAGLLPAGPYMATYYATKAYVTSITQAVARELKENESFVYVGALCPGPVNTEFNQVANVEFALKGIRADYCVRYTLRQMKKRQVIIIPTLFMKLATTVGHLVPRTIAVSIASSQQRKKLGK